MVRAGSACADPGGGYLSSRCLAVYRGYVAWPLLLLSPWFFLLGTLVFLREPRPPVAQAAFGLFACAAFALGLTPSTVQGSPLTTAANHALVTLFPAAFLLFFLTFPLRRGGTRLYVLVLTPALLVAMLNVLSVARPTLYDTARLLQTSILALYLVIGVAVSVYSFVVGGDRDARRGLAIIAAGTALSVLPFVGLYLAPTLLGWPDLLAAEYAILPLGLLPISFAYAILRHHVLPVPLLQRWLVRGIAWAGVILPYSAVVWAQYVLLEPVPEPWRSVIKAATLVLLVAVSYGWLRDRLLAVADRLIFKDAYDYRGSLQALSRDLSVAGNLDTLGAWLPGTLRRLMNLEFALLLVPDRGGTQVLGADGEYRPEMVTELAAAMSEVGETPAVVPLAYGYLNVLLVPLRSRGEVVGYLCLGPKATGEPFRDEDRDLLATLSGQVAGVVRNAQLVEELRAKVDALDELNERLAHAQEEERVRLSADIHDEPLQTAIALQRRLAAEGGAGDADGHVALSQAVVDQLRSVCASMRPSALDDLGLQDALDALALELGERAGVTITLETDAEMAGAVLPPDAELVLYRAAQEAVNNALRHAQPSCVRISLRREAGAVRLCVVDDGKGFSVPDSFDDLVPAGHIGLAGLRERVQRAGGGLRVCSEPGEGTTVRVDLPVEELQG